MPIPSKCPLCHRHLCDHTAEERGQTFGQMMGDEALDTAGIDAPVHTEDNRPHYVALTRSTLYEFPNKTTFMRFIRARAAGRKTQRADLAHCRDEAVTPSEYGGRFIGRLWRMEEPGIAPKDWQDLGSMIDPEPLPPGTPY